ncbi:MAG: Nif3-like dinuclear metal center hexameric protein [Candidatus Cloacimonetes bacterium HGW-Cloacimonetes-1]|jgi:dinuclear metal center YbgI/SA1388 family protein|nr:MAG: Nif3-like dinuclear metal center hexameric protein [Candidatus Cloacimonetes bacterium HGW-Cloacimonetes-1]
MKIFELLQELDRKAPLGLALSWDNCGLQIGSPQREIRQILISLDVTPSAVAKAIEIGADLIVSHHPLIFNAIKSITNPLYLELIEHRIAVISLHTNLDVADNGVNHALAAALDLIPISHLTHETGSTWYHLSVTCPPEAIAKVRSAAYAAGAGRIGTYTGCSTVHGVTGSFVPLEGSTPTVGEIGTEEVVLEQELEMMVDSFQLQAVVAAITHTHPYETPAVYYYPVANPNPAYGLGLICTPRQQMTLRELATDVKARLGTGSLRLWTAGMDVDMKITRIAICGGAGGSMIREATGQADVLITGDISYHGYLDSKIPLLDAGHFYTEYPVLKSLQEYFSGLSIASTVLPIEDHEFSRNFHNI